MTKRVKAEEKSRDGMKEQDTMPANWKYFDCISCITHCKNSLCWNGGRSGVSRHRAAMAKASFPRQASGTLSEDARGTVEPVISDMN